MLDYLGWPEVWCTAYLRYDLPLNVLGNEVDASRTTEDTAQPEMCGHNDHVGVGSYAELHSQLCRQRESSRARKLDRVESLQGLD